MLSNTMTVTKRVHLLKVVEEGTHAHYLTLSSLAFTWSTEVAAGCGKIAVEN